MTTRDSLHQLVEELPEGELPTALRFLQYLKDVSEDAPDAYHPYAHSAMREVEYDDDLELAEPEGDPESVADAWQQYFATKSRSADYGF